MCGIAGIVPHSGGQPADELRLRAMCDLMVHRGPDGSGMHVEQGVGIGMRRLAIIDVECGRQPYFNEDRSTRVVFNGEIYNFRELRQQLSARGHVFDSETDGEVIVHLWEEYGIRFPEYLNGMFAIALHDVRAQRVVLVRDRLGIKPLFYAHTARHLIFGSELKVVLESGLVERRLDIPATADFLSWEYVPAPRTLLQDVKKLEPGTLLELRLDNGASTHRTYWDIPAVDGGNARSDEEWEEVVDAQLRQSVRRQLVSDVPLGAFLSGGVDSSLVVAAMGPAQTFSIGFDDPSYNESAWARRVADHLGVQHEMEVIRPRAADLFERLMSYMDDPIGDFSIFPTFLVSEVARRSVTVALTGDGGDELFGGYETYVAQQKARMWNRIPSLLRIGVAERVIQGLRPRPEKKGIVNKAKRFVEGLQHDPDLEHARWRLFVGDATRSTLFSAAARTELAHPASRHVLDLRTAAGPRSEIDRGLYVDVKSYLADNCLVKVDRMSMACSLEARVPFLDHELVELAFQMPDHLKVHRGRTKVLLKRVAARHVPSEAVYRPKQGFSIPLKHWLRSELRPLVDELLSAEHLERGGIFEPRAVAQLCSEHMQGRANHSHVLWSLLVFQDWRSRWKV